MKFFKSSKKKSGEKSRSSLFGSSKKSGSKKQLIAQKNNQKNSTEADVTEPANFSIQTDTVMTTVTPQWLDGSGATSIQGNDHGSRNAYDRQALEDGDESQTDLFSSGKAFNAAHKTTTNKPFEDEDESRNNLRGNDYVSCSSESECDIGDMETSADLLKSMLALLTEKERKEWADEVDTSSKNEGGGGTKVDCVGMLRKTVVRMNVEEDELEVQCLGTRIIYHLSKLQNKRRKSIVKQKDVVSWYDTENETTTYPGPVSTGDDEEKELMTDAVEAILQAMEAFPDDEDLIENACLALETASEQRNMNSSAKRILEEVLLAMEGFADNPVIVSSSLGLLGNLSSPSKNESKADDLRRRLAKYALPSILHGMKEHREDLELYTKGCKAMANFTKDDPNAQRILACKENLSLRIISEGLKYWEIGGLDEFAFLQRLRLQLAAMSVLKNLSTNQSLEVKGKIVLGGGAAQIIDRLLETLVLIGKDLTENNYNVGELRTSQTDQVDEDDEVGLSLSIMKSALQTIENLADIESIVNKDDRSPHMPTIQRNSAIDNSSAEGIQRQLSKTVKPVLNIVRQHPNRKALLCNCLGCLRQLAISHADSIANHGGISTFLNVLSSPAVTVFNDSILHERALSCLTGLLSPSSNADGLDLVASMETEDGLEAIFRLIRQYQSNTAVIETAYESLFYLSCRVRVVLSSIVGRHSSIANGVGAQSARSLQNQLCLEENVFVMLGTLNQYLEASESISQRGLGLLLNVHAFLTEGEQQRQIEPDMLASNGGIRLVLAVMRRHGLAIGIQEYGVGLLAGILKSAVSYDIIRREFYDEEGISTILAAMMIHPGHAAVQSHGCDVLIQLIAINKHPMEEGYSETAALAAYYKRCILEETNAMAVVQDSLDRFRTHKVVQYFGTTLLQELSKRTTVTPLSALPSKAASISTKLQSSILSSTSMISSSIRSSME